MPLFGLRTHKKYDKDFSQEKSAKPVANKESKTKAAKTTTVVPVKAKTVSQTVTTLLTGGSSLAANAIIKPHVTEKSGMISQNGAYTFQVARSANKQTISKAVTALYKVHPVKVSIVNIQPKRVFVRGKAGTVSGMKKAVVTLKKGDKIDFV